MCNTVKLSISFCYTFGIGVLFNRQTTIASTELAVLLQPLLMSRDFGQ